MNEYPPIFPIAGSWITAPATAETVIWQARSGTALLTTNDVPSEEGSIFLSAGQAIAIGPGHQAHVSTLPGTPAHVTRNAA